MFDVNEETANSVETVYAVAERLQRGQILTHQQIKAILKVNPHEGPWGSVMNKVRKRLQNERGIATLPETTVGYKLLTVAEQLNLPGYRMRRAMRQVRRGRRSVEALPDRSMTANQRRTRLLLASRSLDMEIGLRREIRVQAEQNTASPTVPRRPLPAGIREASLG